MTRFDRHHRRGAAAIEFGMWIPVLAILLAGIVDLGWYMSRLHLVQRAAMDGVRYGVTVYEDPAQYTAGELMVPAAKDWTVSILNDMDFDFEEEDVVGTYVENDPFDRLEVTIAVDHQTLVGIVPMPGQMKARFTMMAEIQR